MRFVEDAKGTALRWIIGFLVIVGIFALACGACFDNGQIGEAFATGVIAAMSMLAAALIAVITYVEA